MFLDPYEAKALEYLVGIAFLVLFAGFWRYATGGVTATRVAVRRRAAKAEEMFRVPENVLVHPGHTWARVAAPGIVLVGIDDFAQRLVGPLKGFTTPAVGDRIEQGERAFGLKADSKAVEVLAPVSGQVLAVNERALSNPASVNSDPYGEGWLLKVQAPRLATASHQLLSGNAARYLMTSSWEELSALFGPQLGTVMHDGGLPIDGFARAVDETNWDEVARRFLRS